MAALLIKNGIGLKLLPLKWLAVLLVNETLNKREGDNTEKEEEPAESSRTVSVALKHRIQYKSIL